MERLVADMKTYRGFPNDPPTVTVDDAGGPRFLKPKNEDIGFAWGNPYEGAGPGQLTNATEEEAAKVREHFRLRSAGINQLILAIATDALGNEEDAVKVYQRLKHRTVLTWPRSQPWSITDSAILKMVEQIQEIERETAHLRRSNYPREVVSEGGAGIVWDTDDQGRRRRPR